ncbi:MAG: TonB family protein [Chitinivibrionales bacterium]|nr:TonB family protein [Chitinivibrionales bacterium]
MLAKFSKDIGSPVIKFIAVLAINFMLFVTIPIIQDYMQFLKEEKLPSRTQNRIVAEIVQPKKKEEKKQKQQRIRKVRSGEAKEGGKSMKFKFSPDLGVEGGEGVAVQTQGDMEAVVFEEGETDEPFVVINRQPPPYPDRARELGIEGALELLFVIGVDGKVHDLEIVRSPHPTISKEARNAVSKWKFKPAKNKGVPVKVRVRQVFEYKLD